MGRVSVPLVTPFYSNEDVNYDALTQLVNFVIARDYWDSIIVTGTTGEIYSLTDEERLEIWRVALDANRGRVPMVAGVGAAATRTAVRLARRAEHMGFDVAMCVLLCYSKPTQEGILEHFRAVAGATALPILVYNIPLFTGVNMEPETLERAGRVHVDVEPHAGDAASRARIISHRAEQPGALPVAFVPLPAAQRPIQFTRADVGHP